MKKFTLILGIVLTLSIFASCSTIRDYQKVHVGMNKTEVVQLFGVPDSTGFENGKEYYIYNSIPTGLLSDVYVDYKISFDSNGLVAEYGQTNSYRDSNVYIYNTNKK